MAILKTLLLLSSIFFGYIETVSGSYSEDVTSMFNSLVRQLPEHRDCVSKAERRMRQSNFTESDKKYVVAIIHLYTNECPEGDPFYKTLNSEMRSGNPSGVWKTAGDLINQGLDILGLEVYKLVYRGCLVFDDDPKVGDTNFRFNQITSTSLNKDVALDHTGGCGILFKIENVYGLAVKDFSEYALEKEVIIKSTSKFKVTDVTQDTSEIENKIGTQGGHLKKLVYLDGQPSVNKCFKFQSETYLLLSIAIQIILLV